MNDETLSKAPMKPIAFRGDELDKLTELSQACEKAHEVWVQADQARDKAKEVLWDWVKENHPETKEAFGLTLDEDYLESDKVIYVKAVEDDCSCGGAEMPEFIQDLAKKLGGKVGQIEIPAN